MKDDLVSLLRDRGEKLYRIDFYKRKLDQASIRPLDIKTLDDFKKIPFTSSSEVLGELKRKPSVCSLSK